MPLINRTFYLKYWLSPPVLGEWDQLTTIVKVESRVEYLNGKYAGKKTEEKRYYISSLCADAGQQGIITRHHWGIENKVHWVLDVAFKEDDSRIRKGYGPQNMALVRHIALNKLKNEKSFKRGIKAKRKKAGWNNDYLIKVLVT